MDTIRRALGEDEISYFGFSYGSELGATWTTLFPDTVRAAVLDGATDPNADAVEGSMQQIAGFEATFDTFLDQCSDDPDCAFHNDGDAEGAFDQLMLKIDEKPLPSNDGRPSVTRGVALQAVAEAMYSDQLWDTLEDGARPGLARRRFGPARPLRLVLPAPGRRHVGQLAGGVPDDPCAWTRRSASPSRRTTPSPQSSTRSRHALPRDHRDLLLHVLPRLDRSADRDHGAGAGPIVVCGTTGDPSTPLQSTRNMAETLEDARLIIIDADQHTCYGADPCADELIDDYLVNLIAPPPVTEC